MEEKKRSQVKYLGALCMTTKRNHTVSAVHSLIVAVSIERKWENDVTNDDVLFMVTKGHYNRASITIIITVRFKVLQTKRIKREKGAYVKTSQRPSQPVLRFSFHRFIVIIAPAAATTIHSCFIALPLIVVELSMMVMEGWRIVTLLGLMFEDEI
ncbi:unnamed protein product [Thelazia callipaeda]|uniref:Transmembrane protein n=1 Tax=Thelazia callipaeda TaxID=103827 RepID=A0A0N5D0Y8_THECL|nr:unnamed protein product [Thelazia callipaeda]